MNNVVTKDFPKETLQAIFGTLGEEIDGLRLVEGGEWFAEFKYEKCDVIFAEGNDYYEVTRIRSGSYFTDYYYEESDWPDMVECTKVERVPVTKFEWRPVRAS